MEDILQILNISSHYEFLKIFLQPSVKLSHLQGFCLSRARRAFSHILLNSVKALLALNR